MIIYIIHKYDTVKNKIIIKTIQSASKYFLHFDVCFELSEDPYYLH